MEKGSSHSHSSVDSYGSLNDLTEDELHKMIQETLQANTVLEAETFMFERHLARIEQKEGIKDSGPPSTQSISVRDPSYRKRSRSLMASTDRSQRLTAEQKCDIAQKEIEALKTSIIKVDEESEKSLDYYKAIMEEAEINLSELKKEYYEFERDVLKGALHPRTNKIIAEKCLRFFEDKIKARDLLIEKFRLKNAALKIQMKKMKQQLKQKAEMGEVLNEVDFNQLKIENEQYLEKIDERNQDLLRLKLMTGNTLQVLNSYKQRLQTLTKEAVKLQNDLALREDLQQKILAETKMVEAERAQAEKVNKKLRKNLTDFRIPDVMEYVHGKADIYDLQKKIKNWERKVDIAELALSTHTKAWKVLQLQVQRKHDWQDV
ncbi:unnamed protein product [Candidula unifasciata]|uniref:Cilia- and flagella-associated protein 263 n=1 Tax=Candidula unifasciata TaxID=100452 RepID=A0A8S3YFC3_9EUPU|nr:unnamed protein product [Candidula unifasciata]